MNATASFSKRRPLLALRHLAVGLCILAAGHAYAGEILYAIAGVPILEVGMDFPVVLYRVEDDALVKVRTVATRRQNAIVVRSYPEKGLVFIVSNGAAAGWFLVDILDLADMTKERSVDFDLCGGCGYDSARLIDRNGRLVFYLKAGRYDRRSDTLVTQYLGLDLDNGEFVNDIDRGDDGYVMHAGFQSGGVDGSDFVQGIYAREGTPEQPYVASAGRTFDLDWRLPPWYSKPEGGRISQIANNDHVRVLFSASRGDAQWIVFDKAAARWSSVPVSILPGGGARLLRRWIVREDFRPGYNPAAWQDTGSGESDPAPFWMAEDAPDLLPFWSAEGRSNRRQETPTGRLQFYDTRTATLAQHDTGHPDSEILLIDEHGVTYFRVGDQLRRAKIDGGALVNEEFVVRAPEMLAVHWLVQGNE